MKRKKAILLATCLVIGAGMRVFAEGESCANPIQITKDFQRTVSGAGVVWYVANTFDLPLAVDYYPASESQEAPTLELDFGCTPGVYDDPILCSLFCNTNPGYIVLPYSETPSPSYDKDGKLRYHVEMGEFYRDMLLRQGIDYNVEVYVKATFHGKGSIGISPDPFSTCMNGVKFMHLGDTVRVKPQDAQRYVVVPYVQWQYDSIRYIWNGEKKVTLAVMGKNCDFDPLDNADENMLQYKRLNPGDTLKMRAEDIRRYLNDATKQKDGGLYYAKFYSDAAGVIKIERVPAAPPDGGAILLQYDKDTEVRANGMDDLYAIPSSWKQATLFTTPASKAFHMYVGTTSSFTEGTAIASYQFDKIPNGHQLGLLESEMQTLQAQTTGKYLYLRFQCSQTTTIRPTLWAPSDCMSQAERLKLNEDITIAARSKVHYRLYYTDIQGGDLTISWQCQTGACPFFLGDSCIKADENDSHVFYTGKISKNNKIEFTQSEVASWAGHVDGDGYLYARFNPNGKGTITFTTTSSGETDPTYPRTTIHVSCLDGEDGIRIEVRQAQTIVIRDSNGNELWRQDMVPDEQQTVNLPHGNYVLYGEKEQIALWL